MLLYGLLPDFFALAPVADPARQCSPKANPENGRDRRIIFLGVLRDYR